MTRIEFSQKDKDEMHAELMVAYYERVCPELLELEHEMTPEEAEQELKDHWKYLLQLMPPEKAERHYERFCKKQPERLERVKERNKDVEESRKDYESYKALLSALKAE
jgi:hypothetical protein